MKQESESARIELENKERALQLKRLALEKKERDLQEKRDKIEKREGLIRALEEQYQ